MVVVSYSGKEINAKLVYYGAGLSGKTTNLESIFEAVPDTSRGKMVSMKTQSDRTLFFDLLPLDLGEIMGFKTRFLLYTVPGQVFYNATRKLVLKGADAVVFVADSEIGKMDENKESLANLHANLIEYGVKLEEIPLVFQYNKRDLENKYSVEELNAALNPDGAIPWFEAVASQSKGVFETFRGVSHLLMEKVTKDLRRTPLSSSSTRAPRPSEPAVAGPAHNPLSLPNISAIPLPSNRASVDTPPSASDSRNPLEFGREVSLPQDVAAGVAPESPLPALRRPEPALASRIDRLEPEHHQRVAAAPLTAAAVSTMAEAPPRPKAEPTLSVAVQASIEPELSSSRIRPGLRASETAAETEIAEAVVPVTVPRGGTREIVLRIIITDAE